MNTQDAIDTLKYLISEIELTNIPETIQLSGMTVNLRQRLLDFIKGTCQPVGKVYTADFLRWVEYEGIKSLLNLNTEETR